MKNKIVKYVVRVPGETSWSEHHTENAAIREAETANRIFRPGHKVFAVDRNGNAALVDYIVDAFVWSAQKTFYWITS